MGVRLQSPRRRVGSNATTPKTGPSRRDAPARSPVLCRRTSPLAFSPPRRIGWTTTKQRSSLDMGSFCHMVRPCRSYRSCRVRLHATPRAGVVPSLFARPHCPSFWGVPKRGNQRSKPSGGTFVGDAIPGMKDSARLLKKITGFPEILPSSLASGLTVGLTSINFG